jgi:protoporphyrinogen oxidase
MSPTRREFIKFVVAGSVAAGCPLDLALLAAGPEVNPEVDGEHYEVCHQVRDGHQLARPPISSRHDIVIVGGGISGLTAAYFLQPYNFLLLEKEDHWGGNAYMEEYQGQGFATGAAFDFMGSESDHLARELGLKMLPINNPDPSIIDGKWIGDTWRGGLDQLPYPESVRESFKKFKREMLALDVKSHPEHYDNEPLSKYLAGHPPELTRWWDTFGPSNWGAKAAETSVFVAMSDFRDMAAEHAPDPRVTLPGGNGAFAKRLADTLLPNHRERMLAGATTIAVEPQKGGARVTYAHQNQLKTVAAKAVIMATPKFITARLVSGLPDEQHDAMLAMRYIPYPVVNLVFDKPVYNRGYDTWCPGNTFTDFIVADWTVQKEPGYKSKNNILTCYTPLAESERRKLLGIESAQQVAASVLRDFKRLLPELDVDPVEVHLYRRGHPMFVSTPGTYTKLIPAAKQPMERVFFANTDSEGPESLTAGAVVAARRASEWTKKLLASGSSAQASPHR